MTSQTNEQAFEATVESMLLDGGWRAGNLGEWDVDRALFPAGVTAFLKATQPTLWVEMAGLHGENLDAMIVDAVGEGAGP